MSVILTPEEESVLDAQNHARSQMANRYNRKFQIDSFEKHAIVSLKIPKQDRGTLDYPRIYVRVLGQPHPRRYQLQTQYGILEHFYPMAELNRVPSLVGS